jgi:hypothetical protein
MNIELTKEWRIDTDPMNFMLQTRRVVQNGKTKGDVVWDTVGFYGNLDHALEAFLKHSMLRSDITGIDELKSLLASVRSIVDGVRKGLAV